MKYLVSALTLTAFSLSAIAQEPSALSPQNEPAPAPPVPPTPVDAEAVKNAETALKESAKAYAQAKALTDTITFEAAAEGNTQKETMVVAMQGADKARVVISTMTLTAVKPSLYIVRDGVDDKYAEFMIDADVVAAMEREMGFAPPQLIAANTDDLDRLVQAWTFGMLPMPKISGYTKSTGATSPDDVLLTGQDGEATISLNANTHLVEKVSIRSKPQDVELKATLTCEPKISDSVEPAIAFEAGTRTKVSSVQDLQVDLTGKPAPDFTLQTLDGNKVTLSELKGNVVVLDFWAMWCGPCKMALPKLQEFTTWAKDSDKAVKVFAVDVWEKSKPEDTPGIVEKFWTEKGYTIPVLLDLDSAVAKKFGFDSIPTTIIIDPKGNVFRVHSGYNTEMVTELKKDVEEAMAAAK